MSKAFWLGGILTGLGVGLALGSYSHPYEVCKRKYPNIDEHILECVWLLENQPALR